MAQMEISLAEYMLNPSEFYGLDILVSFSSQLHIILQTERKPANYLFEAHAPLSEN
jgi:hypothetical protein